MGTAAVIGDRRGLLQPRAGLVSWHRAESQPGSDGDAVGESHPISGRNALQTTAANKPLLKRSIAAFNNKSVYRFDGTNDYLSLFSLTKPANWTVLIVCAKTSVSTRGVVCGALNAALQSKTAWGMIDTRRSGVDGSFAYQFGDDTNASIGDTAGGVLVAGTAAILMARYTSGQTFAELGKDGTLVSTTPNSSAASTCAGTAQEFAIGRQGAGANYFGGDIAEWLIWNRTLTDAEVTVETRRLGTDYAITVP